MRSDRPRWQLPVLVLAIVLVIGQVIVFVAIRGGSKDTPIDAGTVSMPVEPPIALGSSSVLPPAPAPVDASTVEPAAPIDATVEREPEEETPKVTTPVKRVTRAELLAQKRKEEQEAREAREERARQDKAQLEQQQKLRDDLDKQRLATQKAELEAAAAKAAAERAKLEAAKQIATPVTPVTPAQPAVAPAPDVLVFVLGPGTPSVTPADVKAVFLGRTSVWPNGTTARPFNRPGGTQAARKFYGGVLRMSGGDFAEHWSEIQLAGNGIPPSTAGSGSTAVAKVGATQGGFTYVMESELPANVTGVRLIRLK